MKAEIDKTQLNSKCRLCEDGDKMVYYIIKECSKRAQKKYKTRHEWVGRMFYRELCKRSKSDHNKEWSMHKPESVVEMSRLKFSGILRYKRIT